MEDILIFDKEKFSNGLEKISVCNSYERAEHRVKRETRIKKSGPIWSRKSETQEYWRVCAWALGYDEYDYDQLVDIDSEGKYIEEVIDLLDSIRSPKNENFFNKETNSFWTKTRVTLTLSGSIDKELYYFFDNQEDVEKFISSVVKVTGKDFIVCSDNEVVEYKSKDYE